MNTDAFELFGSEDWHNNLTSKSKFTCKIRIWVKHSEKQGMCYVVSRQVQIFAQEVALLKNTNIFKMCQFFRFRKTALNLFKLVNGSNVNFKWFHWFISFLPVLQMVLLVDDPFQVYGFSSYDLLT